MTYHAVEKPERYYQEAFMALGVLMILLAVSCRLRAGEAGEEKSQAGADWPENLPEDTRPPSVPQPPPARELLNALADLSTSGKVFFIIADPKNKLLSGAAALKWVPAGDTLKAGITVTRLRFNCRRLETLSRSGVFDRRGRRMTEAFVTETRLLPSGRLREETWKGPLKGGIWKMTHVLTLVSHPESDEDVFSPITDVPRPPASLPLNIGSGNRRSNDGWRNLMRSEKIYSRREVRLTEDDNFVTPSFWWVIVCNPESLLDSGIDGELYMVNLRRFLPPARLRMHAAHPYTVPDVPEPATLELRPSSAAAGIATTEEEIDAAVEKIIGSAESADPLMSAEEGAEALRGMMLLRTLRPMDELERSRVITADAWYDVTDAMKPALLVAVRKLDESSTYLPVDRKTYRESLVRLKEALSIEK